MEYPNLKEEKRLWEKGFEIVAGVDEVGRGPLAGPVVAVAVAIKKLQLVKAKQKKPALLEFGIWDLGVGIPKLKDSKKLTSNQREKIYKLITKSPFIEWGIGRVSEKVIDKINILEATKLAMERAVKNLEKKLKRKVDFLILDGNFKINLPVPQKPVVKGDEKVFSCTIASIIAKVIRDRMMERYAKKFPEYGFEKHKGYLTKFHLKMIQKHGLCKIHRKSFSPIAKI